MWRPWAKSTALRVHDTSSFACSSFKDVHLLISDHHQPSAARFFNRVRLATSLLRNWPKPEPEQPEPEPEPKQPKPEPEPEPLVQEISLPGSEKRIVVYYTSLRVVRSTFELCKEVLTILQGFRVSIDERDLSMDSSFLRELESIVGVRDNNIGLSLPRVFIGGRYIGGAEEIRNLHETGELKKVVQGFPVVKSGGTCGACGGHRFILCDECSGSHKLYSDKGGPAGFRICSACNENGLIRCPSCACP